MPPERIIPTPPPGWSGHDGSPARPDFNGREAAGAGQDLANDKRTAALPRGRAADLSAWENLMREALREAQKALSLGEVPVGAIVVDASGSIIGRGHNAPVSGNDPAAHAEITAIRAAARQSGNYRLNGSVLLATLEPCLMCAGAAVQARLAGVVYGARDPGAGAVESRLEALELDFHNHRPWHMGGILQEECAELLNSFFTGRRQNQRDAK